MASVIDAAFVWQEDNINSRNLQIFPASIVMVYVANADSCFCPAHVH